MEFLFGAIVATLSMLMGKVYLNKFNTTKPLKVPVMSQSTRFQVIRPFLQYMDYSSAIPETQSTKFYTDNSIKVLFTEGQAYWVSNNSFYTADINEEGLVEEESTREVDIMAMSKVELEEMFFIVEKLTEGKRNDNWGSGNS